MSASDLIAVKRQSLLRSTSLVSLMTFLSRIMGFARDMLLAYFFGAQASIDAFYVAFRIPNFMRRLFAEGAFSQAFVPVLSEYQQTHSPAEVRTFIARVSGHLGAVLFLITVIGILLAPVIIFIFAPGFGEGSDRTLLATQMLRITFPYLMFISLTAMAGAVLNTYGYFGIPAFTPILLNISIILAACYISPHFAHPGVGLAWGVFIAGIVQLLFQIPFLYRRGLLVKPRLHWGDDGVKRVMKLMVPALFGVSVAQLNLMVDSIFASFLPVGSVTWLYFTDRLTDFPLGVFGAAIATVILPHLSRRHVEANREKFSHELDWGLRLILLIGVPAGIGLILFSLPMLATSFGYGKFIAFDVTQTQKSLMTLSLGLPAFMMVKVLASGFYAQQDIKTPGKIGAFTMIVNSLLCAILILPLAHAGLTLASALAGYVNAGWLLTVLLRRKLYHPEQGWGKFALQLTAANAAMGFYLFKVAGEVTYWMTLAIAPRVTMLLGHVFIAMLIYLVSLFLLGVRLGHFRHS